MIFEKKTNKKGNATRGLNVAEPPKTSDDYAYVPENLRSMSGVLGEPRIIHDFRAGSHYRVNSVLQQFIQIDTSE